MRILHIADVHLDRPFVGHAPADAAARRRDVMSTFERCLDLALERDAFAVTIGGDLWEDEHVTSDTRQSVADLLGQTSLPTLVVAGNHDPKLPGGNHERARWPTNVTVFEPGEPAPVRLCDEVTVWGVSWGSSPLTARFLEQFRTPQDGTAHALLLHGTHRRGAHHLHDEEAYCPFDAEQIGDAGFDLCLAGHLHSASVEGPVVYPGSPEPLGWGETGRHCAAIVELVPGREPEVDLVDVNSARYETYDVDVAGASSSVALREQLETAIAADLSDAVYAKVRLVGEIEPGCVVDVAALTSVAASGFAGLRIEDLTQPGYDFDALAGESGARGEFVRRMRERADFAEDEDARELARRALVAGVRALDGSRELLGVD